MKHNVIKSFIDKNTGIGYNVGNAFESDDSERVAFLNKNGYIDGDVEIVDAQYHELKAMAKELNIDGYNKMKKETLIEAIEKAKVEGTDKKASE